MFKRNEIKQLVILLGILLSNETYANGQFVASNPSDKLVGTIYSPTVTVYPDDDIQAFPKVMNVKLLIDTKGKVEQIYYPEQTKLPVQKKVDYAVKTARFTPYIRNGVPTKSIIPYTVIFDFMSEEDYRGK